MNRLAARSLLLPGIWAWSAFCTGQDARAGDRPDVVILYTDDQRFDSMSCTGNPYVQTPHLDRLAREGVRFENSFVPMSVCNPGRMAFLTGQYPHRNGVVWNYPTQEDLEDDRLFPELFQEVGYETAFLGKWHLSPTLEPAPGFDHWLSFDGQGLYHQRAYHENGESRYIGGGAHTSDILTDAAIEWIGRPREKPFLLILSLKSCHTPRKPADRFAGALDDAGVRLPVAEGGAVDDRPQDAWGLADRKTRVLDNAEALRREYQRYLELVLGVDDSLGRLLTALEDAGRLDSTLVLMTSDNGYLFGEHGSLGKSQVFEPALRVPLLVRLPGEIPAGLVLSQSVMNVDVAPTLLELCSIPVPEDMQGQSFRRLWHEPETAAWRSATLHSSPIQDLRVPAPPQIAVRAWPYKYSVLKADGGPVEVLVNLAEDPGEHRDLATDPGHQEIVERMRGELRRLMEELEVPAGWGRNLRRVTRNQRKDAETRDD